MNQISSSAVTEASKLEFHIAASPTPSFYHQIALFSMGLQRLGLPYSSAKVIVSLGGGIVDDTPAFWEASFPNLHFLWCPTPLVERFSHLAPGVQRLYNLGQDADMAFLCDADTLLVRPIDDLFYLASKDDELAGMIAHHPIPFKRGLPNQEVWSELASLLNTSKPELKYFHSMPTPQFSDEQRKCPFYVNMGFLAGSPRSLQKLLPFLVPYIEQLTGLLEKPYFAGQAALPFSMQAAGLTGKALPMRYNFPNDPVADQLWPEELTNVVLFHYLRLKSFSRSTFLADEMEFLKFLGAPLVGSNYSFQSWVREITGGQYPFIASGA